MSKKITQTNSVAQSMSQKMKTHNSPFISPSILTAEETPRQAHSRRKAVMVHLLGNTKDAIPASFNYTY